MTTDAGSGFDDQAGARDAGTNLDDIEEESRHLAGDEPGDGATEAEEEVRERKHTHDSVADAFQDG
ncbi:MAG TPA: hypothetical protein VHK02_07040 [Actinomycetota bacterium]|jgi:hypothetical protein|nr:hypothetical protein [Actinomycetota bacterium]